MERELNEILYGYGIYSVQFTCDKMLERVYNLFKNDILYDPENYDEDRILGLYFSCVKEDHVNAVKYFSMADKNKGNINAMNKMENCYHDIQKDNETEKYLLIASNRGDGDAVNNLAIYYCDIKRDYDSAEKYFLMAIDKGSIHAMNNLAKYYCNIRKDYDNAEKHFLMAIDKGSIDAMKNLATYYCDIKKDYDKAEKYYLMALTCADKDNIKDNIDVVDNLIIYYEDYIKNDIKLLEHLINYQNIIKRQKIIETIKRICNNEINKDLEQKFFDLMIDFEFDDNDDIPPVLKTLFYSMHYNIDIMDLHFKYSLNGKGFNDAKNDFLSSIIDKKKF